MTTCSENQPSVVLVHGMWSDQDTLETVEEAFKEEGYATCAINLPYHYSKAEHTESSKARLAQTRLQDYVAYIVEQVKQLQQPPILVGHSMGGLLVQLVAAQVPCHRLILLSSAAPAGINGVSVSVLRTLGSNLLRVPLWRRITEVNLRIFDTALPTHKAQSVSKKFLRARLMNPAWQLFRFPWGYCCADILRLM